MIVLTKSFVLTLFVFTAVFSHSQISKVFGKKEAFTPTLDIPGTTFTPSGIPIQEKYNGKIVFSDEQLTKENTTEDKFKTTLEMGAPIWGRVFLPNQVGNYMVYNNFYCQTPCAKDESQNIHDEHTTYYYIDDSLLTTIIGSNTSSNGLAAVQTWQQLIFVPSSNSYDWSGDHVRKYLNNLEPGIHKVRVEVWAGRESRYGLSYKPIAEGEFELNVSGNSTIKIGKTWNELKNGAMASDAKTKATLTELAATEMKTHYPDITVKEYKVLSDDYGVQKEYNYPKFRHVQVAAYGADANGKCFVFYMLFAQDYEGGGVYSSNYYHWGNTNQDEVDCE